MGTASSFSEHEQIRVISMCSMFLLRRKMRKILCSENIIPFTISLFAWGERKTHKTLFVLVRNGVVRPSMILVQTIFVKYCEMKPAQSTGPVDWAFEEIGLDWFLLGKFIVFSISIVMFMISY